MQIAECYKILNVVPGEEWLRVRKSYHSLAKQYHPDINHDAGDTPLKEINRAFEELETHYKATDKFQPQQSLELIRQPNKLTNLLGRIRNKPAVQRAVNSSLDFLVDLDSKVFQLDVQKDIQLSGATLKKGASLHFKSGKENFDIKVPTGDWNQMSLRIAGKGESSIFSRRRGDLVLNLRGPMPKMAVSGKSQFSYEMKISRDQIADAKVQTLNSSEGPIKFILPRNIRDEQKFTLRSLGELEVLHILTVRLV